MTETIHSARHEIGRGGLEVALGVLGLGGLVDASAAVGDVMTQGWRVGFAPVPAVAAPEVTADVPGWYGSYAAALHTPTPATPNLINLN